MPGVSRAGDIATCAHTNSGSTSVFANAKGVSKVNDSTAGGGSITGPGISTVLVEGNPIAVGGDSISSHGDSPHQFAKTSNESSDVFAG